MTQKHMIFWGCVTALLFAFVWAFQSVLLPFIVGIAIAYLLNPSVNALGRAGVSRSIVTVIILSVFFMLVAAFLALVTPIAVRQGMELADSLPSYIDRLIAFLSPYADQLASALGQGETLDLRSLLQSHLGTATSIGKTVITTMLSGLGAGGQAVTGVLSLLIITPLVAFFAIKDWPHITSWVEDLFPRPHKKTILGLLKEMDQKLSGFVRGQLTVALVLAIFYAAALTLAGLNYGLVVGFLIGVLSIIPMIGSVVGLLLGAVLAWVQMGDLGFVGIIAAIFLFGQFVEGNIIAPKLIGKSVGMHPVWIFFALIAGGSLFGILGMFLAVPVAAVAGVLIAFGVKNYKQSTIYKGKSATRKRKSKSKARK